MLRFINGYIFRLFMLAMVICGTLTMTACEPDEAVIEEIGKDDKMWVALNGDAWFYGSYDNMRNYGVMRIGEIRIDGKWYEFCPDICIDNRVVRGVIFPDGIDPEDMYTVNTGGERIYSAKQSYDSYEGIYKLSVFFVPDNGYLSEDIVDSDIEFVALKGFEYGKRYTSEDSAVYFVIEDDMTFTLYDGRSVVTGEVIQKNKDVILKASDGDRYVFVREIGDEGMCYAADRSTGNVLISNYAWFCAE